MELPSTNIEIETKPDFLKALHRIYAWYEGEIIDRVPIRFSAHNEEYVNTNEIDYDPEKWKAIWFDTETVVDNFIKKIENKKFLAETFPVFWPNLGPDVYAAFYGCKLKYADITSWSEPCVNDESDIVKLVFNKENEYFRKLNEITEYALERCNSRYLVGYTDLHPGMDCVLAWRGSEKICFDLLESPDMVRKMIEIASKDFKFIYEHFDSILKRNGHLSITWMGIPSLKKFHIPSCDFATMISPKQFDEFALPPIIDEIKIADHNIFHLDGKGVAKNIDVLLDLPEITAIQWVQGVGEDEPIMQWIPLIKKIQQAGKSIVLNLKKEELEGFIDAMSPEGLLLCVHEGDEKEQQRIINRIEKW
jgi:hypothetical protein